MLSLSERVPEGRWGGGAFSSRSCCAHLPSHSLGTRLACTTPSGAHLQQVPAAPSRPRSTGIGPVSQGVQSAAAGSATSDTAPCKQLPRECPRHSSRWLPAHWPSPLAQGTRTSLPELAAPGTGHSLLVVRVAGEVIRGSLHSRPPI